MVSEISFLSVSHYKSTETLERQACPRGLIGWFYEGAGVNINTYKDIGCGPHGSWKQDFSQGLNWQVLWRGGGRHNTYKGIGCGPHGSRKQDFLKLFPFNLQGGASLIPGGLISRIYVGDY